MDRLAFAEYVDAVEGDDILTLKFEDRDVLLFDTLIEQGTGWWDSLAVVFGYEGGDMSPRHLVQVKTMRREGDQIVIKAHGGHRLINTNFMAMQFSRGLGNDGGRFKQVRAPEDTKTNQGRVLMSFGNPNMTDRDLFQEIIVAIAEENGFRFEDIRFLDTPPEKHPEFTDRGLFLITKNNPENQNQLSWALALDRITAAVDWRWRIHHGLFIVEPNDHIDRAGMELLYKGAQGSYATEYQRDILEDSLDVDADVMELPKAVQTRGFDPLEQKHITGTADTRDVERRVGVVDVGAESLTDRSTAVVVTDTRFEDEDGAIYEAEQIFKTIEKDILKVGCQVHGVPRLVSGHQILLVLPSIVLSGAYEIAEARHEIIPQGGGPYITEYALRRRHVQRIWTKIRKSQKELAAERVARAARDERAKLLEKQLAEEYGTEPYHRDYRNAGTLTPQRVGHAQVDSDVPPARNIPSQ